ncbi:FmdB family zinc ribbon protein [Alkalicoccus chagannorensis]|uniref:FmdB family zinc ribbon protein n=1 Tax=Alkalicoccus chagannorensis TaxID=427072 RepID=UPI00040D7B41|nr:FmdB family zinc ribbon protein [Alkalicoccus chagannorensis]
MPNYTFLCGGCGEFTQWHQSSRGPKSHALCPVCLHIARRQFKPVYTFRMDSSVKKRMEQGMEPRIVSRNQLPSTPIRKSVPHGRPWQV